ncbi:trypsin-1-like [Ixodes scapularis]|uniref:trypsin-1-like n=1 Tax=Ixodes scapularis TaxID=6945 RepID=UPI001161AAB2|nr:trypsin-1-like [Ixodes scapularis]
MPVKGNFLGRQDPADIVVQAGILDLNNPPIYCELRHVRKIAIHESYRFLVNNIALLKLDVPFDFAKSQWHIGAVCLPAKDHPLKGNVVVTGWGAISHGRPTSSHLLALSVPVRPPMICTRQTQESYNSKIMFCAASPGRDSCQGDFGGPAVQKESGSSILVGVVSYGAPCGLVPVIYTRVSAYTAWIYKNIAKLQS